VLHLNRIIETALHVDDFERAKSFYGTLLGLKTLLESPTLTAYDVGGQSVLLLFLRGASLQRQVFPALPGSPEGEIPPHDGSGSLHICFAIAADELHGWEAKLKEAGIEIEGRMKWVRGGESIYFRDPDGHLLEFMTPGNWAIY
jgi:catechol 2,3-dioxygenase-like lactoylglutathione lyase family enzyme